MNIILIEPPQDTIWSIEQPRQRQHIQQVLKSKVGDQLKVGIINSARFTCEIVALTEQNILVRPLYADPVPAKIPVTLIVALPRPKVLRRLVADSVALGVKKLVLIHSYRVDKSYWQTPFLQQLDHYMQLGLEQSGDVHAIPIEHYPRFKPFVEDVLSQWTQQQPSFVAHPYATHTAPINFHQACQLIIGPEGGFIPYEIDLMQRHSVQPIHLGTRVLRTETAIPVLLSRLFPLG